MSSSQPVMQQAMNQGLREKQIYLTKLSIPHVFQSVKIPENNRTRGQLLVSRVTGHVDLGKFHLYDKGVNQALRSMTRAKTY